MPVITAFAGGGYGHLGFRTSGTCLTQLHGCVRIVLSGDPGNTLGGLSFYYQADNVVDKLTEGRPLQGLGIPLDVPTAAVDVDQDVSGSTLTSRA
jgi:hypothetical protein